jgi:hypothetical protein
VAPPTAVPDARAVVGHTTPIGAWTTIQFFPRSALPTIGAGFLGMSAIVQPDGDEPPVLTTARRPP